MLKGSQIRFDSMSINEVAIKTETWLMLGLYFQGIRCSNEPPEKKTQIASEVRNGEHD